MSESTRNLVGWLFNIDWNSIPDGSKVHFQFASLPTGWGATASVVAGIVLFILFLTLYRREGSQLSGFKKLSLFLLRAGVVLLAFLICFRPVLVAKTTVEKPAHFLILIDTSASMTRRDKNLPDELAAAFAKALELKPEEVRKLRRYDLALALIERKKSKLIHGLRDKSIVDIFTFNAGVAEIKTLAQLDPDEATKADQTPWSGPRLALKDFGRATHLGGAVREVLSRFEGEPVAGILVISDGKSNGGPEISEAMLFAHQRRVPIWAVGVGDPNPPKNVELRTITAPPAVFQGTDPYEISAEIFHQGFVGESVHIVLERLEGDAVTELKSVDKELGPESKPTVVTFRMIPEKLGLFRYRVRVEPLAKEENKQDNARSTSVQVKDSWFKVLLVSGGPTFEYRVLRNYLGREKELELSQWLQSAPDPWNIQQNQWYWGAARVRKARKLQKIGETDKAVKLMSQVIAAKIASWAPTARAELKNWGRTAVEVSVEKDSWDTKLDLQTDLAKRYDVIILLDADPAEIEREAIEAIHEFVEDKGGGLMFVAGEKYAYPWLSNPALSGFAQLLPVIPALDTAGDRYEVGRLYQSPFTPVLTTEGITHHLTQIVENDYDRNRELWASLPGMYWAFPVKKHKPHARVLLRHSSPDETGTDGKETVLAAIHNFGPGKVLWMGFDETYRWRANAEVVYQQFWTKAVRHLTTGKLLGGKRRARFVLHQTEFDVGEPIRIQLEALAADYASPLQEDEVHVEIVGPQDGNVTLKPIEGSPGWFEGTYHAPKAGEYTLHLEGFQKRAYIPAQLQIIPARLEFREPLLDLPALTQLTAGAKNPTKKEVESGGSQTSELVPGRGMVLQPIQLKLLPGLVQDAAITLEEPRPPNELWASPLVIMLFTLLLTAEWLIRKLSNLL